MKNKALKFFAMLLPMTMLLSACGQTAESGNNSGTAESESTVETVEKETSSEEVSAPETEYPEYLNMDGAYPIIKDGYEDEITLTMLIGMQDDSGKWEDLWISQYLSDKYNINLEVEYVTGSNNERKNLILAANELPDIMLNCFMTTSELVKYGAEEGIFLQMDSYMNETLTPNILKYMVDDVKAACTAPDGHIYTLPHLKDVTEPNSNEPARLFINNAWLQELGIELPRTLDEFVDALYAIKKADPSGVGSENLYPMGGGMDISNNPKYLLNALGYIAFQTDNYGLKPTLRDGEVVIPAYDMDVFQEYLKLMNQFFNDGIIAPTFFTMDTTEMNAQMVAEQTAMYANAPYLPGNENWADFECLYPLTSEWQTEPEIAAPPATTIGSFVISADTEYPELCLRLADAFFNNTDDYCAAMGGGYGIDSEYSYGFLQKEYLPESNSWAVDSNKTPGNISSWNYVVQYLTGNTWNVGAHALPESIERLVALQGNPDFKSKLDTSGKNVWRVSVGEHMSPYAVNGFPTILYYTDDINQKIMDLETVITPYAKEQIALFITGKRDLSEVDAFKEELKRMGMEDLQNIYKDLYSTYMQD